MSAANNVPVSASVGGTQIPGGKWWALATDGDSEPPARVAVGATRPPGQVIPHTLAGRDANDDSRGAAFWALVLKTEGCWLWAGARDRDGYGFCSYGGSRRFAHRVAYELAVGPIPEGLQIDHLCRRRWCVRPDHLDPVTATENIRRARPYRSHLGPSTECKYGHVRTPENTRMGLNGNREPFRRCRDCEAARSGEQNRRRREARAASRLATQPSAAVTSTFPATES